MKKQLLLIMLGCWSLGIQAQQSSNNISQTDLKEKQTVKSSDFDSEGAKLLTTHELKSNETYDFKSSNSESEYELEPFSSSAVLEVSESSDANKISTNSEPLYDPIESIFQSDSNKQQTKKKQKTKRKKKGTGLLIAGTALYIALQLLK